MVTRTGASVRKAENTSLVEVRDFNSKTTKVEKILVAISGQRNHHGVRVVSIRKAFVEIQTAIMMLPNQAARWLCEAKIPSRSRLRMNQAFRASSQVLHIPGLWSRIAGVCKRG